MQRRNGITGKTKASMTALLTALSLQFFPIVAHADIISDAVGAVSGVGSAIVGGITGAVTDTVNAGFASANGFICNGILTLASWLFSSYFSTMQGLSDISFITGPMDKLLGDTSAVWNFIIGCQQTMIIPIAESILGLFMLVQLIKISQRMDSTATLPAVKDIFFLFVTCVIIHWFIVNSLDVLSGIYEIFNNITATLLSNHGADTGIGADLTTLDLGAAVKDPSTLSFGKVVFITFIGLICWGSGLVCYVIAAAVSFIRSFEITIQCAFAPISFALLGFDSTRQMGIGFLKNFAASCLSGAVIALILISFPYIMSAFAFGSSDGFSAQMILDFVTSDSSVDIGRIMVVLGITVATTMLLLQNSSIAKKVFGDAA